MGQNCAAIPRLRLHGKRGQTITLRFAEHLRSDGTLYTTNLRTATSIDTYVCRGGGEEVWSPRFTYHGYQYIEITGVSQPPTAETLVSVPISSDTAITGTFKCSDETVNKLSRNIYWSQRSNFVDVPTDCPQRDERLGWTCDAQIFLHAAAVRADVQTFFAKWLTDLDDAQHEDGLYPWVAPQVAACAEHAGEMWESCSPAWSDAGVICPWTVYQVYEDKRQLARHYPNMVRFIEWTRRNSRPDLLP